MRTFTLGQFARTPYQVTAVIVILLGLLTTCVCAESDASTKPSPADIIRSAVAEGKLAYKLTTPEELKALFGTTIKEEKKQDGGMDTLLIEYPNTRAKFGKMRNNSNPFTLLWLVHNGKGIDIGQDRKVVLRNENDLKKFDTFWGFANVSLVNIDLREYGDLLRAMPFDSQTEWPEPNKMPEGFNPSLLLEDGKDPGLGVCDLHKQGIDGRGVGIAIIDQPLLKEHQEYSERLVYYKELEVEGVPIQMHGPPVCSIAVGKTCGVAPKASLYYYAVPPWKWTDNKPWADVLDEIIAFNKTLKDSEKIRVVSISLGAFSQRPNFDSWEKAAKKAAEHGILVVTCDPTFLKLGTLKRIEGKSPEEPSSYDRSKYYHPGATLAVPTSNRTIASYHGCQVYTYERTGGMSWAVPYLAGLAALAYQVDPEIKPGRIVELWLQTAVQTDVGPIVNPIVFIECVQKPDKASTLIAEIVNTKSKAPNWVLEGRPIKASQIPQEDYKYLAGWLDKHSKWPIDYFIELFKKRQVVIVGESHNVKEHKDFIIKRLIPRLYHEADVRCMGWEFSRHTDNERLDKLVTSDVFDKEAGLEFARDQLAHEWNSKEHWDIIEAVWKLNKSLRPGQQKMQLIGLDKDWNAPRVLIVLKTKPEDSPEFQEVLTEVLKRDATMANQVEKEIIEKGQKGLVFVGRCHDFTHHKFPPKINMGRDIMGNLLYKKYGNRVFQVWFSSGLLSPIEDIMKLRGHRPCGFDLYDSPFANILTPPNWDAPEVPLSNVARGFIYFRPRANLHRNTPIKGFVTKEMFEQHKKYYEIDFGRTFKDAQDVDTYLQTHRFPKP